MEPERKIEKLLRAFAKKRRADAGDLAGLHPATRRMLQARVAKQFAEPPEEDSISLWQLFRQRWAVVLGFALLIFFGTSLFLPALSKAKSRAHSIVAMNNLRQIGVAAQMAANENNGQLPATLDALTNGYVSDNVLTDPVSGKRFIYVAAGEKLGELQSNSVLAYSPGDKKGRATVLLANGTVQMMGAEQFADRSRSGLLQRNAPQELAVNSAPTAAAPAANYPVSAVNYPAPAATPVPAAGGIAMNDKDSSGNLGAKDDGIEIERHDEVVMAERKELFKSAGAAQSLASAQANVSQKFVQTVNHDERTPPILVSFEVQQNGHALAVVDHDGSVYNGFITVESNASQNAAATPVKYQDRMAAKSEPVQAQANFSFRVAGQNRTSKQNVVFTGNLIPLPGTNAGTQFSLIFNARISGTATVDATNQIKVDAVPAAP